VAFNLLNLRLEQVCLVVAEDASRFGEGLFRITSVEHLIVERELMKKIKIATNGGLWRLFVCVALLACMVSAQSLTTGDIAGVVRDPSGAVIQNATVTLKSLDTGATQEAKSNTVGEYRFRLLKPGRYTVTVAQAGFQKLERAAEVTVGGLASIDMQLVVGQATQTVEVTAEAPLINTEASTNTLYNTQELTQLPSAGGDITNIAYTAPGVVVNTTAGYGNFQINGLPATIIRALRT